MSRRLSLHILLPIEGYEEDKIYKSEDISLRMADLRQEPDNIYYIRLKSKFMHHLMILLDWQVKNIHWVKYIIFRCIQII